MSRPFYETKRDRTNEIAAIKMMVGDKYDIRKLPVQYNVDFALFKDQKLAYWVEVKCPTHTKDKYPTFIISAAKIIKGYDLSQKTGAPFVFVVRWSDAIGHYRVDTLNGIPIKWGGRTDRNDDQDQEPLFFIPIKDFKVKSI